MLWFSVWFMLVLAMIAGAFVLGRSLWRSARALLAELEKSAAAAARLDELRSQIQERFPEPVPPTQDLEADAEAIAGFRAVRAAHEASVNRRRLARVDRARAHWRWIGSPL